MIPVATLALGKEYRLLASLLALDLQDLAPRTPFVILTDCPSDFRIHPNVEAVRHVDRGVFGCYHDKRFVVAEALRRYGGCLFLDADCRLVAPPPDLSSLGRGLHAAFPKSLYRKMTEEEERETNAHRARLNNAARRNQLLCAAASQLKVDLKHCMFVPESCFAIFGEADAFLRTWDWLARRFMLRGWPWGEGRSIALAAESAGWTVTQIQPDVRAWLWNDQFAAKGDFQRLQQERRLAAGVGRRSRLHRIRSLLRSLVNTGRLLVDKRAP